MLLSILLFLAFFQQGLAKLTVPGATNVVRVDTTFACAGATTPEAFPEIKRLGFVSILNLRRDQEPGADISGGRAAAAAAGLKFIHIPFDSANPDPAVADAFLKAVTDRSNQPAYIHCASGNRASALWLIKRVVVDGWDIPRATEEATAIGLTHENLRQFALDYATRHKDTKVPESHGAGVHGTR